MIWQFEPHVSYLPTHHPLDCFPAADTSAFIGGEGMILWVGWSIRSNSVLPL